MLVTVLMVLAFLLFCGMAGDKENMNKRTYSYGFVACVIAAAAIEIVGKIL